SITPRPCLSSLAREVAMPGTAIATTARQPALQVNRRTSGGDTVIELKGKLDSSLSAQVRAEAIALAQPGCRLVLDLSGLEDISPTGVRMLLMFFRRVHAEGGTISVKGAAPKVFEVADAGALRHLC